jgi:hypothetical protein
MASLSSLASFHARTPNKTQYWFGLIRNFKRGKKEVKVGMID